jgi:polar amino acid transport system substrate-binding protein
MSIPRFRRARGTALLAVAAVLAAALTACSDNESDASDAADGTVTVGAFSNGAAKQVDIKVSQIDSIRAQLPAAVVKRGQLTIGQGALPSGFPPLSFIGSDQKTLTGSEPDLGRLIAAVFGLKPVATNSTWDNLFVGIDSGKNDVGISNITDTEQRKLKYDFACYRQDNLGFEVLKSSSWNFNGNYETLAGQTASVSSGTNQEKILLQWQKQLKAKGKKLTIKYFPDQNGVNLALSSGKIDTYFGPNPGIQYRATQNAKTTHPTRNAGKWSGAGATLQGLICATTKKDNGLVKPLAAAINYLIKSEAYAKLLAAWNLSNEAVPSSTINPPGLPITNS